MKNFILFCVGFFILFFALVASGAISHTQFGEQLADMMDNSWEWIKATTEPIIQWIADLF